MDQESKRGLRRPPRPLQVLRPLAPKVGAPGYEVFQRSIPSGNPRRVRHQPQSRRCPKLTGPPTEISNTEGNIEISGSRQIQKQFGGVATSGMCPAFRVLEVAGSSA